MPLVILQPCDIFHKGSILPVLQPQIDARLFFKKAGHVWKKKPLSLPVELHGHRSQLFSLKLFVQPHFFIHVVRKFLVEDGVTLDCFLFVLSSSLSFFLSSHNLCLGGVTSLKGFFTYLEWLHVRWNHMRLYEKWFLMRSCGSASKTVLSSLKLCMSCCSRLQISALFCWEAFVFICNVIHHTVKRRLFIARGWGLFSPSVLLMKFVIQGHTQVYIFLSARPLSLDHEHYLLRWRIDFCSSSSTPLQSRHSPAMCNVKSHLDIRTSPFVVVDLLPRNNRMGHGVYTEDSRDDGLTCIWILSYQGTDVCFFFSLLCWQSSLY